MKRFKGWIPDFDANEFFYGEITIQGEIIQDVARLKGRKKRPVERDICLLPGLIDAHVHIESSMLTPSAFAKQAIKFGTVATVSDPHEIANVLGRAGVEFMFSDAKRVPLKMYFTAPSCVPATAFEESGAILGSEDLKVLAKGNKFVALGEMMNYPGVIGDDQNVIEKLELFHGLNLPIDGHAPQVKGGQLKKYREAGISTDHEASSLEEALEKIGLGMKIIIREGSAAKNFEELWPLIESHPQMVMLCCDDIHPDELLKHHIDHLIIRGQKKGLGIIDLLRAATINPIDHYNLDVGILKPGDKADFIIVKNLDNFEIEESYINGQCVYLNGSVNFNVQESSTPNNFNRKRVSDEDFLMFGESGKYRAIGVIDGNLNTTSEQSILESVDGVVSPDNEQDILRIAVVNRYRNTAPSLGWIKNTGLKVGALASSVAHDSHNIVVMGVSPVDMAKAVNLIIDNRGGISYSGLDSDGILPLPVAGLMSNKEAELVGEKYSELNNKAKEFGSTLTAPFMTLSFMALLVIPELKIGDKGLFDVKEFKFVEPKI